MCNQPEVMPDRGLSRDREAFWPKSLIEDRSALNQGGGGQQEREGNVGLIYPSVILVFRLEEKPRLLIGKLGTAFKKEMITSASILVLQGEVRENVYCLGQKSPGSR